MNSNQETEVSQPRVNIGIRISPELKEELNYEALELGQTSSQYGETLLHNRHMYREEIKQLTNALKVSEQTISNLQQLAIGKEKLETEVANYRKEVHDLKAQLTKLNEQHNLLKDKRLLYLFEQLKGKKDIVENTFGDDFDIVYDSPEAVLRALIYSCKLNK